MSKRLKKVYYVVETTSNWPMVEPYPTLKEAQKRLKECVDIETKGGMYDILESSDLYCILYNSNLLCDHFGSRIIYRIYDHIPQINGHYAPAWRNPKIKIPSNLEEYGIKKPKIIKDKDFEILEDKKIKKSKKK